MSSITLRTKRDGENLVAADSDAKWNLMALYSATHVRARTQAETTKLRRVLAREGFALKVARS